MSRRLLGVSVPADIRPVMVALLLGIVTDYAVFFLSALRTDLRAAATTARRRRGDRAHDTDRRRRG